MVQGLADDGTATARISDAPVSVGQLTLPVQSSQYDGQPCASARHAAAGHRLTEEGGRDLLALRDPKISVERDGLTARLKHESPLVRQWTLLRMLGDRHAGGDGPRDRPRDGRQDVPDLIPARMLNEFAYCPRLAYLEWVQGEFADNLDVLEGRFGHRRVEKPSREEVPEPPAAADQEPGSGPGAMAGSVGRPATPGRSCSPRPARG
jgi:hypothetical protein